MQVPPSRPSNRPYWPWVRLRCSQTVRPRAPRERALLQAWPSAVATSGWRTAATAGSWNTLPRSPRACPSTLELGQGVAAFTGTSTAEASGLLTDASATWTASQFVGYYLEYTSGIDVGQSALITANTFDTITTAAFGTLPTVGSTFAVIPFQDGGENQNFASPTSQTLDLPLGITFSGGNLWVADSGNNRVLEFTAPFTNGEAASKVIGQSSFTSYTISSSASGLDVPRAVAFDSAGDLWVTDTANNRSWISQLPSQAMKPLQRSSDSPDLTRSPAL